MKHRLKVAFLSFNFGEYCVRLASALAREVEILLLLPQQLAAPYLSKVPHTFNFQHFYNPRLRQPFQQLRMINSLLRRIRNFNPDVIHYQHGHPWFNLALPLLERYSLVLTIHDPRHHVGDRLSQKTPQTLMDFGNRRADQVIVHGKKIMQMLPDLFQIPAERIHVIPHIALGDDTFQKEVQEDGHLILFFGRIWEYKGLEYLINAEPLITAQVPEARIMIAGYGEDFTRYRRMMVHPEHFIVYNEYVSEDKVVEFFRRASIVVLPYTAASQSGVIPIAYTFAKPVVATKVGALPEMVDHGETGFLVPPRDEGALADAIVRLLRNREMRRQFGARGKLKIDTECSPKMVARQTLAVYHLAVNHENVSAGKKKS